MAKETNSYVQIKCYNQGGTTQQWELYLSNVEEVRYINLYKSGSSYTMTCRDEDGEYLGSYTFTPPTTDTAVFKGLSSAPNCRVPTYAIQDDGSTRIRVNWLEGQHSIYYSYIPKELSVPDSQKFAVSFYKCADNPNRLDKTLEDAQTVTGCLSEGCSIQKPVIEVSDSWVNPQIDLTTYNYCVITAFHRCYQIVDVEFPLKYGIWKVHCEVDVLYSYKNLIKSSNFYCYRSSANFDARLFDSDLPVWGFKASKWFYSTTPVGHGTQLMGQMGATSNNIMLHARASFTKSMATDTPTARGDRAFCKTIRNQPITAFQPHSTYDNYFMISSYNMQKYLSSLTKKTTGTAIINARVFPVDLTQYVPAGSYGYLRPLNETLKWGDQTDAQAYSISAVGTCVPIPIAVFTGIDEGDTTDECLFSTSPFDNDHYCSWVMHVPYAPPITLSKDLCASSDTLIVYFTLDPFSGSCKYYVVGGIGIKAYDLSKGKILATSEANIGFEVTVTRTDTSGVWGNSHTSIPLYGTGASVIQGVYGLFNETERLQASNVCTTSGGNANWHDGNVAIRKIYRTPTVNANYNYCHGRPTNKGGAVEDFTGVVWGDIKLAQTGTFTADYFITNEEKLAIIDWFKKGVDLN